MPTKTTKTDDEKPPRKALHASETASAEAREQAHEYGGIYAPWPLTLDDGTEMQIPPHPDYQMLDDERMQAYEELLFEADTEYERGPDIFVPEQRIKDVDGNDTGITTPSETIRGPLLRPLRKRDDDGNIVLVKPPHSMRVVQACLGELEYKRLREGGRSAADVWKLWTEQSEVINAHNSRDSKSAGSTVGVATVSKTDSQ